MKENGTKILKREMEKVIKYGLMDHFMRVTGKMIRQMERVELIHADGDVYEGEWKDDKATWIWKIHAYRWCSIRKDTGKKTNSTVKVKKPGQTTLVIKEIT